MAYLELNKKKILSMAHFGPLLETEKNSKCGSFWATIENRKNSKCGSFWTTFVKKFLSVAHFGPLLETLSAVYGSCWVLP